MYILVAGCGRVGSQLATLLSAEGHDVVVLDTENDAFRRLGPSYNGETIVGNAFDPDDLRRAGIEKTDAFCAVTDLDNTNIMASQVAKRLFGVPKVIGRLYNPDRLATYQRLGLDMVCGTTMVARAIKDRVVTVGYDTIAIFPDGEVEVIQFEANRTLAGKRIRDIIIDGEFQPSCIIRAGKSLVATADTVIEERDLIVGSARAEAIPVLRKRFHLAENGGV